MEVGLSPGDFVLDGDPVPLPKRGGATQFSAHVYNCGQTATSTKMSFGMEVGLGLRDSVRWGTHLPPEKGHTHPQPIFGLCLLCPNGWMDQDVTWYGRMPRPRRHCVRWGPSSPMEGAQHPSFFGPCLLWPNGRPCQQLQSSCLKLAARIRHYAGTTYDGRTISDDHATTGLKLRRRFGRRAY